MAQIQKIGKEAAEALFFRIGTDVEPFGVPIQGMPGLHYDQMASSDPPFVPTNQQPFLSRCR
jgi:hypothetical protein